MKPEDNAEYLREIAANAEAFAKANVVEMSRELLDWHNTSILKDGRVRELAMMLLPLTGSCALSVAEAYVQRAAFEFVIQSVKASS